MSGRCGECMLWIYMLCTGLLIVLVGSVDCARFGRRLVYVEEA